MKLKKVHNLCLFCTIFQDSPKDESSLLKAVHNIHKMIDKEIAVGTNPENVFICGFSQGGLFLSLSLTQKQITYEWSFRTTFYLNTLVLMCVFLPFVSFTGALTLASVLLYPKTLGGGAVFSGWVPFSSSILQQITPAAKKVSLDRLVGIWCCRSISSF